MKWLAAIILFIFGSIIRKLLLIVILIGAILFFSTPYVLSYYFSDITGTEISCSVSYKKLALGTLYFDRLEIFSTENFNKKPALSFYDMEYDFDFFSILSSRKVIKEISAEKVVATSIDLDGKNNISEVVTILKQRFRESDSEKEEKCAVNNITLKNVVMSVYSNGEKRTTTKLSEYNEADKVFESFSEAILRGPIEVAYNDIKYKAAATNLLTDVWNSIF